MKKIPVLSLTTFAFLTTLLCGISSAQVITYEGFTGDTGLPTDMLGASNTAGGSFASTGFVGAWQNGFNNGDAQRVESATPLTYTDSLGNVHTSSGDSVALITDGSINYRSVSASSFAANGSVTGTNGTGNGTGGTLPLVGFNGTSSTTIYLSFVMSNAATGSSDAFILGNGNNNGGVLGIGLLDNNNMAIQTLHVGGDGGTSGAVTDLVASGPGTVPNTGTNLFVAKLTFNGGVSDSVTVWEDPTLGGSGTPASFLASATATGDFAFNSEQLRAFNGPVSFADLTIGNTLADVTAIATVPEPSSYGLMALGLGAFVLLGLRRRMTV
jgi:PEP-CTERM motif